MPELDVPCATNSPNTCNDFPLANFTSTPASTVNFAPLLTNTVPVTTYGLPDALHVVSEDKVPLTSVAKARSAHRTEANAISPKLRDLLRVFIEDMAGLLMNHEILS